MRKVKGGVMSKIKKILMGLVIGLVVLIVVLAVGKNVIIKAAVTTGVKAVTGLKLDIDSMDIGMVKTLISIKGLKLYNPPEFEDELMIDIPEVHVDYKLGAFIKDKKIHLEEVRLNLNEFLIVKNKDGVLNLDSLKAVQAAEPADAPKEEKPEEKKPKEKAPEMQIDLLLLKLNKVIVKDYTGGGEPKVSEYNLNIDERYENITNLQSVVSIIVLKAMSNAAIAKFTNLDMGPLVDGLGDTVGNAGKLLQGVGSGALDLGKDVGGVATDTVKETTKKLKNLLPFGKK